MDKKELFRKMKVLNARLAEYNKTKVLKMTAEEKTSLIDIFKDISPRSTIDLGCSTCVLHYLNIVQSYFEREYPKFLDTLTEDEKIEETKVRLSQEELMAKMWAARKESCRKRREEKANEGK